MSSFDLDTLTAAVGGEVAAIRTITHLDPAGANGPLVFELGGRDGGEPRRFSLSKTEVAASGEAEGATEGKG